MMYRCSDILHSNMIDIRVYCNMKSLSISNVETVIIFRSLAPLVVSFLEATFLGRELPSLRSFGALSLIALGALGYANSDDSFQEQGLKAYIWPFYYLATISFEMVYGKKIVKSVKFKTFSGPVQYTNLLSWPPCILFAAMGGEFTKLNKALDGQSLLTYIATLPPVAGWLLLLGCVTGTAIGYSSWWCRDKISATSFTLVGVMNKCLTVLVNCLIWDQHANASGIACLFLCLIGGALYQQAPMSKVKTKDNDEEYDDDDDSKKGITDEEVEVLLQSNDNDEKC